VDLRGDIDGLIASGDAAAACRHLGELWRREAGAACAAFVVSRYERLRESAGFVPYRVAILRSFTVEPAVTMLRAEAFTFGIDLQVHIGDFNAYAQEILDGDSAAYRFAPDAVILAVLGDDVAPDLFRGYADLTPAAADDAIARVSGAFDDWVRAFRTHSPSHLILSTLEQPSHPSLGLLDAQSVATQSGRIAQINSALRRLAAAYRGVHVLDYDGLVARHGRLRWRDERKWLTARMPVAAGHLIDLAREWVRFLVPLSGKMAKALAVDLDNTLWGGIIGEDGLGGIRIGAEYPGASYQALQRALLDLSRRGILLAVCSRNNRDEAMEALEHHPGMLLRPAHFAAMRINWEDKMRNLQEIAAELNIGLDALAFLDDSPVECDRIRTSLPAVTVIQLPADPVDYAGTVRASPVFERLTLSAEDLRRTTVYAAQTERAEAARRFASKEDFYRFLDQDAEIARVAPDTIARVSQLTQKTNQFNLTTRRYTEQQIADIAAAPDHQVLALRVRDRYGDQGIVGVAITRDQGDECHVDTFLLSCRVIGRTVETAFLSYLAQSAWSRQRRTLVGRLIPTRKNEPAREFYARHGFRLHAEDGEGSSWVLDLESGRVQCPEWITLRVEDHLDVDGVSAGPTYCR
jgi:FkbH-like protein